MLYINKAKGNYGGMAKVKDIRMFGLIQASMRQGIIDERVFIEVN